MLDANQTITVAEASQAVVAALAFAELGIGISATEEGGAFLHPGAGVCVHLCETATELLALAQQMADGLRGVPRTYGRTDYDLTVLGGANDEPATHTPTNDAPLDSEEVRATDARKEERTTPAGTEQPGKEALQMKSVKTLRTEGLRAIGELRERGIEPRAWDGGDTPDWPSGEWECCLCGQTFPVLYTPEGTETRIGMNNPAPLGNADDDVCCASCNQAAVMPSRIAMGNPKHGTSPRTLAYFAHMMQSGLWVDVTPTQEVAS
ncbi:MAG: hypothetical protein IKF14_03355 [Atopobiaceae bacterium]|nr:hypothetical protein [Atopobiaceae bacterium]